MKNRNNYEIFFFTFVLLVFIRNSVIAQSPFPYKDFFTLEKTTKPIKIYFPDGKLKAIGIPYSNYESSIYKFYESPYTYIDLDSAYSFNKVKNKEKNWKEYYENGQLKFTCIYPPKRVDNLIKQYNKLLDKMSNLLGFFDKHEWSTPLLIFQSALFRNPDKLLDKIESNRRYPFVTFFDTLGNKIAQGEMLFSPSLLKRNYWQYFDANGSVTKEEFFDGYQQGTIPIEQLIFDSTINIPSYFIDLVRQDKIFYTGEQTFSLWQRDYNTENKLIYFRFNNTINFDYEPDFTAYPVSFIIDHQDYDDNYSFKLNENGQLAYLKFSYPFMSGIDSLTDRKIRCLKVKNESKQLKDELMQSSVRSFCELCDEFDEDSSNFAYFDIFEIFFNNDTISKAYGYYSKKTNTTPIQNNNSLDLIDEYKKQVDITFALKEIFTTETVKDIYSFNQKIMYEIFPKERQKQFK